MSNHALDLTVTAEEILAPSAPPIRPLHRRARWVGGVAFTLVVATLGLGLSQLPGFTLIGPLAWGT